MMQPIVWVSDELTRRGKSRKDLAAALADCTYNRLCLILNGFQAEPANFKKDIDTVLQQWDMEAKHE
jgi:hypothetical protein